MTQHQFGEVVLGRFKVLDKVSKSPYGTVFKVRTSDAQKERFALRLVPKNKAKDDSTFAYNEELADTLEVLDHPNIVKVTHKEVSEQHTSFVLEWMGGRTMRDVMQAKPYPENAVHRVMAPLFDAVVYCHNHGVSHQNIQPKKLHFTDADLATTTIKILGFGMRNSVNSFQVMSSHSVFDPSYQAPEMLSSTKLLDEQKFSCDFWSLGVVLYQLLSGSLPFQSEDAFEQIELIKKGDYLMTGPIWDRVSDLAKHFVKGLLKTNQDERLNAEEISNHPWIQQSF